MWGLGSMREPDWTVANGESFCYKCEGKQENRCFDANHVSLPCSDVYPRIAETPEPQEQTGE